MIFTILTINEYHYSSSALYTRVVLASLLTTLAERHVHFPSRFTRQYSFAMYTRCIHRHMKVVNPNPYSRRRMHRTFVLTSSFYLSFVQKQRTMLGRQGRSLVNPLRQQGMLRQRMLYLRRGPLRSLPFPQVPNRHPTLFSLTFCPWISQWTLRLLQLLFVAYA
ncbi:MAG: hypothetical protein [Circular genetic element sp.]|nr:MAG: hypothetical protein [Circular genetic element sp.]